MYRFFIYFAHLPGAVVPCNTMENLCIPYSNETHTFGLRVYSLPYNHVDTRIQVLFFVPP